MKILNKSVDTFIIYPKEQVNVRIILLLLGDVNWFHGKLITDT